MFSKGENLADITSVFNALPGEYLILLADTPRFTVIQATDSYLRHWQLRRESVIGESFLSILSSNTWFNKTITATILQSLDHVLEHKTTHEVSAEFFHTRDGKQTPQENRCSQIQHKPVPDINGAVQYIIHSAEASHSQTAANAAEAGYSFEKTEAGDFQFRSLLEAAPVGIGLLTGPELVIEMANDSFIELLGKGNHIRGLPFAQAMPELEEQPVLNILRNVFANGKAFETIETQVNIRQNGLMKKGFYDFSYTPLFDEKGSVVSVLNVARDVTERVMNRKTLQESELSFRNTILQAPVGMCILRGSSFVVELANARMFELWGAAASEILHKPVFEVLTEAAQNGLENLLHDVYTTGRTYCGNEQPVTVRRAGQPSTIYVNFVYEPLRQGDGAISGVIAVATEVTEQVLSRKWIEETEAELQRKVIDRTASLQQQKFLISSMLEASFNGIYALKAERDSNNIIVDFRYLFANNNVARFLKKSVHELVGNSMLTLIPENGENGFFDTFCRVLATGKAERDETHFITEDINSWFDYVIVPTGPDTLVVTIQDITKQKNAVIQIEQQRNLLDNIMKHSPSAIVVSEIIRDEKGAVDARIVMANATSEKYVGIPMAQLLSKNASEIDPSFPGSPLFEQALHTLQTGEPFTTQYFFEPGAKWLELSVSKMDEDRLINIFMDVTVLKNAQLQIERSEERLKAVFDSAQWGMFTFAPVTDDLGEVTDFRFVITNPNFAAYVGQTPEVLNGELGSTWFPGYLRNGVFDMYKKTFITGETLRMEMHYNVDGLDIYLDLKSTRVAGEVLVTFNDYTSLKRAQLQLEKYVEELKRSNANLEDFAYAASHDLKEPIRKIRTFTDRIKRRLSDRLPEEDLYYFERMEKAADRMQQLIDDLLEYSHVAAKNSSFEEIDLNQKVQRVLEDLELEITEKKANILVGPLPTVKGHRRQIQQIFQNLITNALKFRKRDIVPEIRISSSLVTGGDAVNFDLPEEFKNTLFNEIRISDNGIGFQQEYADKIFKMFQRLHGRTEYEGTGIGLAIVRKVVENHGGFIRAEGNLGQGASFIVLLPAADIY